MRSLRTAIAPTGERAVMLAVLALAALSCLLGLLAEPSTAPHTGKGEQLLDLLRIVSCLALVVALVLGPGIAWRLGGGRRLSLGFLPVPGLLLMMATGTLAWILAGQIEPRVTCFAILAPALGLLAGSLAAGGDDAVFDAEERRCLLVAGCVLGLAAARALWSLGPAGELYGGTISRTLEVGDRSDSRISFHIVQLVANGAARFGDLSTLLFFPYNFSSRGPLPGLGSAPVVLMSGGHPPAAAPEELWAPFDAQGFMAYRLAMMALGCTAFVSLWDLTRRLAGMRAAQFALLLAATTPFLVHEVWFTWPKMLAASFVLLAAICVIERRALRGGLLAGLGYLMHPVALLSLPALALISLWPLQRPRWSQPRVAQLLMLAAGLAVFAVAWRLLNGSHYDQSTFVNYLGDAGINFHPSVGEWLTFRLKSLANTLIPLFLVLASAHNPSLNVVGGSSPGVIHFFFQYWNSLPFGVAIVFFPLLLASLWRALKRWPWAVFATVAVPFVAFAVYWGSSLTGMLREGLQAWVLTLVIVVACQQAAAGFPWLRSQAVKVILTLRTLELLAVAVLPTLATGHMLLSSTFALTDAVAIVAIFGFCAYLGVLVWSQPPAPQRSAALGTAALDSPVDG